MGRQQYLQRLALGRSAFQDIEHETSEADVPEVQTHEHYYQQYDRKSRPVNPSTEASNAAMRDAQNAVLELVGVVERKDLEEEAFEIAKRKLRDKQREMLLLEQDRGEDLDPVADILCELSTWRLKTVLARVQAGLFDSTLPMVDLLSAELNAVTRSGIKTTLLALMAGAPAMLATSFIKVIFDGVMSKGFEHLHSFVDRRPLQRRTRRTISTCLSLLRDCLILSLNVLLLPLAYHVKIQTLGLIAPSPLLPSWNTFRHGGFFSFSSPMWTSTLGLPVLSVVTSPAALLLVREALLRNQDDGIQLINNLTSFDPPEIDTPAAVGNLHPPARHDLIGLVLHQYYTLRRKALFWFGWRIKWIVRNPSHENELANNVLIKAYEPGEAPVLQRSTMLAHVVPQFLAERMDDFAFRLLMLPFESLVMRSITHAFFASSPSSSGSSLTPLYYLPFGGGPLGNLRRSAVNAPAGQELGGYLNKLGLSMAMLYAIDSACFFGLYGVVAWQGIKMFGWARVA